MQSVSSRNWTRVAVSISYDDNHDSTSTSEVNKRFVPEQRSRLCICIVLFAYEYVWVYNSIAIQH